MRFSIIVPIYNVEKYLKQTVESVLQQNFTNYELILVNDGSTDSSGTICNYYSEKYKQVKTIHQKNQGVSNARNAGLRNALGKYIIFLDGDDLMGKNILNILSDVIKNKESPDLISCVMNDYYINGNLVKNSMTLEPLLEIVNRNKLYDELSRSKEAIWSAGRNVYKLSTIKKYNIEFKDNVINAEDCDFFMKFVREADKYMFTDFTLTIYRRERIGSTTHTMSFTSILDQLKVFSDNYYIYQGMHSGMEEFFAEKFTNSVSLISHLKKSSEIEKCQNYIHENREILRSTRRLKYKIAQRLWYNLGYYKGSLLLEKAQNIKKILVN